MIGISFNELLHSATYYLSYQHKIGRNFMIDESSLKYPIADYLTGLEFPISRIKLEYRHPDLKSRRIDVVTTDPGGKFIENAFEFKLAQSTTKNDAEQKRIFHDLARLHLISQSTGASCYFLIAGTQEDFIPNFYSIRSQRPLVNSNKLPDPEGVYKEWFKYVVGKEQTFAVRNVMGNAYEAIYDSFIKDYRLRDETQVLNLPVQIKTKCLAISAISRDYPTPYIGGVWQIT
jgi:hypothetical protein